MCNAQFCVSRVGPSRCLDAFVIALNQACDDRVNKRWYTSTKELQLASLEFCTACRSVPTLHVKVEKGTPTRLWMSAAGRETRNATRLNATRVPVIRAHAVTWKLSASALRSMGDVLSKAKRFMFGDAFNCDVRGVTWPCELEVLRFDDAFSHTITEVTWPESLQELSFTSEFNQPLQGVSWPGSLHRLSLWGVNQPLVGVAWPPSLRTLNIMAALPMGLLPESPGLFRSCGFASGLASTSLSTR